MDAASRRAAIIRSLEDGESLSVSDFAARFGVSEMTVRRDLARLADEGMVAHAGSKTSLRELPYEYSAEQKRRAGWRQKRAIASFCASLVEDGESVFVDAGSTAAEVARALAGRSGITVFTDSLLAAEALSRKARPRVVMCPGEYREKSMGFLGPLTLRFLDKYRFDTVFLGTEGVSLEFGLSVPDIEDGKTKTALVQASRRVICVADSSKFGKEWLCRICDVNAVECIVTDDGLNEQQVKQFTDAGVQVIRATNRSHNPDVQIEL
jgi:DeoR/GlpR family transcriptional regulator of sugar metabolism